MPEPANSKVPRIRFKRFDGEWAEETLGALGHVAMNKRIYKHQTSETDEIPFFKIGTFGKAPDSFISRKLFNEYKSKFPYPSEGDLLISAAGSIGRVVEYSGKDEYFQDSNIVWLQHDGAVVNAFLKQFYSFVKWAGLEGSTIKRLYNKNILETPIVLPDKTEQAQIGGYFREVDRLIGLQQRKHDKLVTLKKAMLHAMFPQPGTTTPEIRFQGFEGPWNTKRLGELGDTYTGLSGKTRADFGHGAGRFVTYMNVFSNPIADEKMVESVEFDSSQNQVKFGDVLFTTSSETPEEVGMSSVWTAHTENVYLNSFCFGFRPKVILNHFFLAYALRSNAFRKRISFLAQGISRYNISKRRTMDLWIALPSLEEEQQKIGHYFRTLDELIAKHALQLQKLKQIKTACLERMFV